MGILGHTWNLELVTFPITNMFKSGPFERVQYLNIRGWSDFCFIIEISIGAGYKIT